MKNYYTYILANKKNGTIYVGITDNLERRIYEHKHSKDFTSRYGVYHLVYFEETNDVNEAIKREKQLKKWNRVWKIELIEKINPNWNDLLEDGIPACARMTSPNNARMTSPNNARMTKKIIGILAIIIICCVLPSKVTASMDPRLREDDSRVLASAATPSPIQPYNGYSLNINIPAIFNSTVKFVKDVVVPNIIYSIKAGVGFKVENNGSTPTLTNTGVLSINGSAGALSLTAGTGINIVSLSGQGVTITNNDAGSAQNIFKTITVAGQPNITASSNSDTLTLSEQPGIAITTDAANKEITLSADGDILNVSGWFDSGSKIYNSTLTDSVGIGTATPSAKLDVEGTESVTGLATLASTLNVSGDALLTGNLSANGNVTLGNNSSDIINFAGRLATGTIIAPSVDLGADLGTSELKFNNLFVTNLNSEHGLTTQGQATFSYSPADTTFLESSFLINPASPVANGYLLGLGVAGYQRAGFDAEGDLRLGYNSAISIPATSPPLAIYGHNGTNVFSIDTTGSLISSGSLDINGTANDIAGALNVSNLTSTGALNVTPASGNNLNVNVSNGGQFTVNNSQLTVNSTTGYTGIGTATASAQLDVAAINGTDAIVLSNNGVKALGVSTGTNSVALNITSTDPTNKLTNGTFESDLTGWTGSQTYSLNDEFTDSGPITLATGALVTLQSGGVNNPTPTAGGEMVTNGGMEGSYTSGIAPNWILLYPGTGFSESTDPHSGDKAQAIREGSGTRMANDINLEAGKWYTVSAWTKMLSGHNAPYLTVSLAHNSSPWEIVAGYSNYAIGDYTFGVGTGRTLYSSIYRVTTYSGRASGLYDDISAKPLTLSSLFSTVPVAATATSTDYTVQADTTLTKGAQAGLVMNLDSTTNPQNFIIAYHDGTNIKLEKAVAGTYTTLISTSATYVPGATIKVVKNGFNYSLYYNGVKIGSTLVITDAGIVNNTNHGVFSTYAGNSFSNFLVQSQVTNPTPVLGGELVTNGGFDSDTSGWSTQNATMASVAGGQSGNALQVNTPTGANPAAYQGITTTSGAWYQSSVYHKDGTIGGVFRIGTSIGGFNNINGGAINDANWTNRNYTFRATGTTTYIFNGINSLTSSDTTLFDTLTFKPLTLSSLFSTVDAGSQNVVISTGTTLTAGTQAGLVLNLDSASNPQNFVIAYHDGTYMHLDKAVGGVYTSLINTAKTYVAGANITVRKNGTRYTLVYNGTQVGSDVTISDAGIINNTIHGLFSTYASNSFSNFSITTNLDGTYATDGVNMRTVTDPQNKLNISDETLNFAGNGVLAYPSTSRIPGKTLIADFTTSNVGASRTWFGWGTNSSYPPDTENIAFYYGSLYSSNIYTGSFTKSTQYKYALIFKSTGTFHFIKGGMYTNWTLLYITPTGSGTNLKPIMTPDPGTSFVGDNVRIPTTIWLPTPLAYDTFTATGSATTETVGPDGQTTPALSWTGSTWTISGGKAINTPTIGNELLINSNMETGNPPSNWNANGHTLTGVADERDGGSGVQSLSVTKVNSNWPGQNSVVATDTWVNVSAWIKVISSSGMNGIQIYQAPSSKTGTLFINAGTNSSWQYYSATGRFPANYGPSFYIGGNAGSEVRYDDVSYKPLTLSTLFSSVSASTADVVADVTLSSLTSGTQAGLVLNLDNPANPQNFIIVYHNGGTLRVEEVVNGVYTEKLSTDVAPGAGQLRVIREGTKLRVYLNNALVGSELTMATNINTNHGLFSTYSGNTFDNFTLWPRGTGNEYAALTPEDLTVTPDTTHTYGASTGSVKLVAGATDNDFTETVNVGDTQTYSLTAYAYTDGSPVSISDLSLYYGSAPLTTSYASVGNSGWYKLTGTLTGIASNQPVGVRVKAGKTVYVDNINLGLSSNVANSTLYVANAGTGVAGLDVQSTSTFHSGLSGGIGLVIMGAGAQTANLSEWKNFSGTTLLTVTSNGFINASTGGAATFTKAGTISDADFVNPVDGLLAIDSADGRLYYRSGGTWSFIGKTEGFQIPAEEVSSLSGLTGQPIQIGDFLIPYVETHMEDGAVHGLYTKFSDVKDALFASQSARLSLLEKNSTDSAEIRDLSSLSVLGISTINDMYTNRLDVGIISLENSSINAIGELNLQTLGNSIQFEGNSFEIDASGNIKLNSGIVMGNENFRGSETLKSGSTVLTISKAWDSAPISITAKARFDTNVWITDVTKNGFVIHTGNTSTKDEIIDWVAIW